MKKAILAASVAAIIGAQTASAFTIQANGQDVDVEGIEPMAHASPVFDRLREDESRDGLNQEDLLRNAPESALGQVRVPKVVDA